MWHVGLLYRSWDLLRLLAKESLPEQSLTSSLATYQGVKLEYLIALVVNAGWAWRDGSGLLHISDFGKLLLDEGDDRRRLQAQIMSLLRHSSPPWKSVMLQGMLAFRKYAPGNVTQCFRDAGFFDESDPISISIWDEARAMCRANLDLANLITGRQGERYSIQYEVARTGKVPKWMSLEVEGAGYDLLSFVEAESEETLLIEVKASRMPVKEAQFYVSRHEWNVLSSATRAEVHLWCLSAESVSFACLTMEMLDSHIPLDRGEGRWDILKCPFSSFTFQPWGVV